MIIRHIELTNWGRHKHLVADNLGSVIGITGPNGCGKSTLLSAIQYGLTGSTTLPLDSYIRLYGSDDGAKKASVHLLVEKNGSIADIYRQISGGASKRKLVWEGKEYTSMKDVDAKLSEIFAADKQAISNAVFVDQGEIDSLISSDQAPRETTIVKLLHLGYLAERASYLKKIYNREVANIVDYRPSLELMLESEKQGAIALEEIKARVATTPDPSIEARAQQDYRRVSNMLDEAVGSRNSTTDALTAARANLELLWANAGTNDKAAFVTVSEQQQELTGLKATVSAWEQYQRVNQTREAIEKRLVTLRSNKTAFEAAIAGAPVVEVATTIQDKITQLAAYQNLVKEHAKREALVEPARSIMIDESNRLEALRKLVELADASYAQVPALQQEYAAKSNMLRFSLSLKNSVKDGCLCPTCHQLVKNIPSDEYIAQEEACVNELNIKIRDLTTSKQNAERAATAQEHVYAQAQATLALAQTDLVACKENLANAVQPTTTETIEELQARLKYSNEMTVWLARTKQEFESNNVAISSDEATLSSLQVTEIPVTDIETTRARVAELEADIERLQQYIRMATDARNNVATLEATLQQKEKHLSECSAEFERVKLLVKPATPEREQELADAMAAYSELIATEKGAEMQLKRAHDDVVELREKVRNTALRYKTLDYISRAVEIMDRKGLPLTYVASVWTHVAAVTQELLLQMEANFSIRVDENTPVSFEFNRTDDANDYWFSQKQLSGGQKIRLAVALLLAIQRTILPEVGFLVLDEPSCHLDEPGVDSLREMLMSVSKQMVGSCSQVLICDHNPGLTPAFDTEIKLS